MTAAKWRRRFNANHGKGSFVKFKACLADPLFTLRDTAKEFGFSHETASNWEDKIPEYAGKRGEIAAGRISYAAGALESLYADPDFANFYDNLIFSSWPRIPTVEPVGELNYARKGAVIVNGKKVVLLKPTKLPYLKARFGDKVYRYAFGTAYEIRVPKEKCDCVYYPHRGDFYLIPRRKLPRTKTVFTDMGHCKYSMFMNSPDALWN